MPQVGLLGAGRHSLFSPISKVQWSGSMGGLGSLKSTKGTVRMGWMIVKVPYVLHNLLRLGWGSRHGLRNTQTLVSTDHTNQFLTPLWT